MNTRKEQVKTIAIQIVTSEIAAGKVDPDNEEEFRTAMKSAVEDAKKAFDAAEEFLSG